MDAEKLAPTWIRFPGRAGCSSSVFRLRYPGLQCSIVYRRKSYRVSAERYEERWRGDTVGEEENGKFVAEIESGKLWTGFIGLL